MRITKTVLFSLFILFPPHLAPAPGENAIVPDALPAFSIRGYHQHIFPDRQPMKVMHQRLEVLTKHGYNMVVFGMGSPGKATITMHEDGTISPNGCSTDAMAELVRHAVKLGLEPVFEMKFIGKQLKLLEGILEKYPRLVIDPKNRSTVLNAAYKLPDGRNAYTATSLAQVDYLLGLYPKGHPAKYFFFGIDEFSGDDLAKLAEKLGMSPPQAFAYCLNLGTDHVLTKGITPLVWGDTMLSPALGTDAHGLTLQGYEPDPRLTFQWGGAYHATFGRSGDHGLHQMINYLKDREKIVVVDWHYAPSPSGQFPSVDYFQKIGFKDVWGAPWHSETNIRQFARYAAGRGCGGMIATAWNDAFSSASQLTLHFIIGSSAAMFLHPSVEPPEAGPAQFTLKGTSPSSFDNAKRTGCILSSDRILQFRSKVPEPIDVRDGQLLISPVTRGGAPLKQALETDPKTRELSAKFTLPEKTGNAQYQLRFCYSDAATGYVYVKQDIQGFLVSDRLPEIPQVKDTSVLIEGDFARVTPARLKRVFWLGGTCAGPLGWASPRRSRATEAPRPGGLDLQWLDRVWLLPSSYLNEELSRGMRLHLEAKMTVGFTGNEYCALFTKGSFHTGFRVLVGHDRHLLFQFAGLDPEAGGPLWVRTPARAIPLQKWVAIDLLYRPPSEERSGRAEINIDGKQAASKPLPRPMPLSTAVIGIGCEFGTPTTGPTGKKRPNFPGLIRKFSLRSL